MTRPVAVGFVPLVDAAAVVIAGALGFDAEEGLDVAPRPQPSWAALRDHLLSGGLDAAHMLAPLPVALRLGLGGLRADVDALSVMSVNGNTIGASAAVAARMRAAGWAGFRTPPAETAAALLAAGGSGDGGGGGGGLRIGVPFLLSTHALLLRRLFEGAGLGPPDLHTVPPPQMVRALEDGQVDAFCVGEPWGSAAVEAGAGEIVLAGRDVWAAAPEKVLAMRAGGDPGLEHALIRTVVRAGAWLDDPANVSLASEILAAGALALPMDVIERALTGRIVARRGDAPVAVPGLLRLGGSAAHFPWRSQGAWIGDRLARAHGGDPAEAAQVGASVFRSDRHRAALAGTGIDLPPASAKREGALAPAPPAASPGEGQPPGSDRFFDGAIFDSGADGPRKL